MTTTIRNIVAATDLSPASYPAIKRGALLAATHGATLCLLHAETSGEQPGAPAPPGPGLRQRLVDEAAALTRRSGLSVTVHSATGTPAQVIADHVRAHDVSLVVIGSRAEPSQAGLGSTALQIVQAPACPVLVARAEGSRGFETVLCAVDLREGSLRAATMATALFPAAQHHLLYALDATGESAVDGPDEAEDRLRAQYEARYERASAELQRLASTLSAKTQRPVQAEVADDVPARAILVAAATLDADCVVVGHHGQGSTTDSGLGSMAQHVVWSAISDVLVVP